MLMKEINFCCQRFDELYAAGRPIRASLTPRLWPPCGAILPDERFLPAGTRVGMVIHHLHYNPDIFPSPRTLGPERWLDNGDANVTGSSK